MRTGPLLLLNLAVAAAVVAGARLVLPPEGGERPAGPRLPRSEDEGTRELERRVQTLEGRVEELSAALAHQREEAKERAAAAETRASGLETRLAEEKARADAAEALLAGSGAVMPAGPGEKKADLDAFAKEVSKAMRQGLGQEFKRIADLVVNPTPEALEQRRMQLRFFANAMGTQAGLDRAQIETLERILEDTDRKARDELRPLLVGVEDPKDLDYPRLKQVTRDSFTQQDKRFEEEFPEDKAERVKKQLEPVRNLFTAMLDDLERQANEEK